MGPAQQAGERIRAVRVALGLTQAEFAEAVSPPVAQATVARWESGDSTPRDHHKRSIAALAGRPARELFPLDPEAVA